MLISPDATVPMPNIPNFTCFNDSILILPCSRYKYTCTFKKHYINIAQFYIKFKKNNIPFMKVFGQAIRMILKGLPPATHINSTRTSFQFKAGCYLFEFSFPYPVGITSFVNHLYYQLYKSYLYFHSSIDFYCTLRYSYRILPKQFDCSDLIITHRFFVRLCIVV